MSRMGDTKQGVELGKVERVVRTLELDAVGWGGAELDDKSASRKSTSVKSSLDSILTSNSFLFFNGSFLLPDFLSHERKRSGHSSETSLLVLGKAELPAGEVGMVPRGEERRQGDNGIGQCQYINTKPPPSAGGV